MARKILIVDDNAINRQMLINALEKDYDIIEAENGREAMTQMHHNYKILSAVLLDIVMPEMDGYDVLRRVRENPLLSQIPIIMVTGTEDEDARIKVLSLGASDFILKPFNPEIVKHCLRNNIALRETASILNAIQKDKLTGLYNREAFFEKVNALVKDREAGYYIISSFDIDNFKLINDQYGAVEGDRILKEIGSALKIVAENIGGLAARISADNFAVLFPSVNSNVDILKAIHDIKPITSEQRSIAFSVGRYLITDIMLPASAIYDRAYLAKQSVKGRYDKHIANFDETMLQKLVRDQQIVSDMEEALKTNQFEVWFQPQYNHDTGALTGAEALVRWAHPQKGIIPPGEFIPLFEQNGFVYELDKYVWRETCRYIRKWMDKGLTPLPVSVNISRYDIFRADLIEVISSIIKEFDVPIVFLRLEITESAFAKSTGLIVDIVKKLIGLGFTIEIDDFGSGYSSLNTLKSVPAQVVKLDMRFLEDSEDSKRGGNILESVVRMTKWLGMAIIAEGVETKQQGDFLKSIGCNHVQGYLYAQPMPAEDFEAHFKDAKTEECLPVIANVGNLDNDKFWDPTSIDSLIFNSYVGSACIYEYYNSKLELVRATDKYAAMFGPDMSVDRLLSLDIAQYIDKSSAAIMFAQTDAAIRSREEITCEFLFVDVPGCPGKTYLRSTMRVIASTDSRYLVYCLSENITAQRLSEKNERKLAKQLQAIMGNINCGITATVLNGKNVDYLLANNKYYELLGYTPELYKHKVASPFDIVLSDDKARVTETVNDMRNSKEPSSMEYRVVRGDGQIIWLRSFLSVSSFEDVEGDVLICTYADITAEKNTAQSLLDNLPCGAGICLINKNDAFMVYLNKRYYTYFKHRNMIGATESAFAAVHPDDREQLKNAMAPALHSGGEGSCVVRIKDGESEYIPFRLSGVAIESEGENNAIYVTFVPIAQEALSVSETLSVALEKVMASSSDLSFIKDKNLKYICCSRAFAKMVGLKDEKDIAGLSDNDLFSAELAERYIIDDNALFESGESIIDKIESIPAENGKSRYSSTSKYLLYDSAGNIAGLYGIGHDITQILETESQQKFLLNNIPGGVAIYEGKWGTLESIRLSYFSDGFCRLFGYSREEYERLGRANPTGLVAEQFLKGFSDEIDSLVKTGTPIDYIYQARSKDGSYRWINVKAVLGESHGENMSVNAVLFDITEHQEALEKLRLSEEENRLAIQHSQSVVCRYDIASKTLKVSANTNSIFEMPSIVKNVPYSQIEQGKISKETVKTYTEFYESINKGKQSGSAVFQRASVIGWRWINAYFSTIFSADKTPIAAVISFHDVTESLEKDIAYKKWTQSLSIKDPKDYSLFRCNISKKTVFDTTEGSLLYIKFKPGPFSFDEHTHDYAEKCVYGEDKSRLIMFLNTDTLLEKYYRGERILTLEYREKLPNSTKDYRWLHLKVDLVEYMYSGSVEAYLLFENIDEEKRAELLMSERAEIDPLTGILNRATFAEKVNCIMSSSRPGTKHALLMLDIDGFKKVNDVFGHAAGDQTLIDIANSLSKILRRDDYVCRLGGDEFFVFLNNIPGEGIASTKAKQICDLSRKSYSAEVHISGSVGIAVFPYDGSDFETLYKKADETLYYVKGSSRNSFAFYRDDMKDEHLVPEPDANIAQTNKMMDKKRRMLIVDDNNLDYEMLANIFKDEFIIEKAKDGNAALVRLKHYKSAISVVLLDLMMPGIDGFAVLEKMRENQEMQSIPVVVVSAADDRATSLKAIRAGASDFVMKPVDTEVLRIRVQSAISKAENERLRAKNSCLELQSDETDRYRTVLDKLGLSVAELDWGKGTFEYSPSLSHHVMGNYDSRPLWHILMTDLVCQTETVRKLQQFVHDLADERERNEDEMNVALKTPEGKTHNFRVNVYKVVNEYALTDKMIMTFKDLDA